MRIVLVIPTYNEAANIERLTLALSSEFQKMPKHKFHILIVDGNSPDGTALIVEKLAKTRPFVHLLLEEEKKGLGAAYIFGFKHAINELKADVVVEMDADFQHNPKDVLRLIREIDNGYDYVIGSRYVKGGSIPKEWAFYRKFLSFGGNLFTKFVLGIFSVSDFTSGFRASRVKGFLENIELDTLLSAGYSYKMDLLFRFYKMGAKIKEIPIAFGVRDRGTSKMEKTNFKDSLRVVLMLRIRESIRFLKFVVVGFIGLFTDLFFSNTLRFLLPWPATAASMAAFVAMTITFVLNNAWSFADKKVTGMRKLLKNFIVYVGFSSVPIVVRYFIVGFAVEKFGNTFWYYNGALFISILFGLIWNYTVYSKIIWCNKESC